MYNTELQNYSNDLKFETINNINDINDINDTIDTNDMANFFRKDQKSAIPFIAALPVGECQLSSDEVSQEAKGVVEIAKPKTLAEEKAILVSQDQWITATGIDYLKVSFWLDEPNNPHSLKLKYSFKRTGRNDLAYNNYSIKLTRNRYDYISNVRDKWVDVNTTCPTYAEIYGYMEEPKLLIYAGKAQKTRKYSRGVQKVPMEPMATTYLFVDDVGDYYLRIRHHEFVCELITPGHLWQEDLAGWIKQWAIRLECPKKNRPKNVPPFYTQVWRI